MKTTNDLFNKGYKREAVSHPPPRKVDMLERLKAMFPTVDAGLVEDMLSVYVYTYVYFTYQGVRPKQALVLFYFYTLRVFFSLSSSDQYLYYHFESGGVVEWLTCRSSNLRIASHIGSNPIGGKLLFS